MNARTRGDLQEIGGRPTRISFGEAHGATLQAGTLSAVEKAEGKFLYLETADLLPCLIYTVWILSPPPRSGDRRPPGVAPRPYLQPRPPGWPLSLSRSRDCPPSRVVDLNRVTRLPRRYTERACASRLIFSCWAGSSFLQKDCVAFSLFREFPSRCLRGHISRLHHQDHRMLRW